MTAPAPTPSTTFAFYPGARGYLIVDLQRALGLEPTGLYDAAIAKRLADRSLDVAVGAQTWSLLTAGHAMQFPGASERAASFLGGLDGFTFDTIVGGGVGLRMGVLGFDIRSGALSEVLHRIPPAMITRLAGNAAKALTDLLENPDQRNAWSVDYSQIKRLLPQVQEGLTRVLASPASRRVQLDMVRERWAEALVAVGSLGGAFVGNSDVTRMRSRLLTFEAMTWNGIEAGPENARWVLHAHYTKPLMATTHHDAMLEFARRAKTVHQDRMLMIVRGSGHYAGRAVRLSDAGV